MASAAAPGVAGSSTMPVSPSATASWAPPLRPAIWGTPAAAASRYTIPNPSCSKPRHRVRHSMANTSAHPSRAATSSSPSLPRSCTGAPVLAARLLRRRRSLPSPAITTCRSRPRAASSAAARTRVSIPLRGTSRETLTTVGISRPQPEAAAQQGPLVAACGTEALDVHARRDHECRQMAAQSPFALEGGVAPRCDHPRGRVEDLAKEPPHSGEPSGYGHFGSVDHHRVGQIEARSDQSRGKCRVYHHEVRAVASCQAVHPSD